MILNNKKSYKISIFLLLKLFKKINLLNNIYKIEEKKNK